MLDGAREIYSKLRENGAFSVLLHPAVMANYWLYGQELRDRPLVMKSQPIWVEIELTNRCNLACVQCLRSRGLRPYRLGQMDFVNYRRILEQFPYVTNLSLNGFGEGLLHPRFLEVVEYTRARRPWAKIGIYTNGMLLDDDVVQRLPTSGLTELNVSIDAAREDTYARVRRGGVLARVHANIARLLHARREAGLRFPMVGMNFVMLNENEGELVRFVEQAAEFGVDFINTITYATYDWGFRNRRTPDSYRRELDVARVRMEQLGVRCKSFPSEDLSWSAADAKFECRAFWGGLGFRVTYDGSVTLGCCTPFKETFSYGNVLREGVLAIWNNSEFQRNRELARRNASPTATCTSCANFGKRFFEIDDAAPDVTGIGGAQAI